MPARDTYHILSRYRWGHDLDVVSFDRVNIIQDSGKYPTFQIVMFVGVTGIDMYPV